MSEKSEEAIGITIGVEKRRIFDFCVLPQKKKITEFSLQEFRSFINNFFD